MNVPYISTKVDEVTDTFDLDSPAGRHEYFQAKAQKEIEYIKSYLDNGGSFVSFWLAKKGAGKGTYSKMFAEVIGEDRVVHISIGDLVRKVHTSMQNTVDREALLTYLQQQYRGPLPIEDAINALITRDVQTLLPTEFILALIKRDLEDIGTKALLIDGFPRGLDQVSYSLYFREIMHLRDDPDFFVIVDVADSVLDARIKRRVVCPLCNLSRNTATLITKEVGYDENNNEYYLVCDNPACAGVDTERLVAKEGGNLGIEGIRDRLEADQELIEYASELQGVEKIFVRNSYQVENAFEYLDEYEISYEHVFTHNKDNGSVSITKEPWVLTDNDGNDIYSVTAPAGTLMFIRQLYKKLQ